MGLTISRWKLWIAGALPVQILLVTVIVENPVWVETYYAQGLYPVVSRGLRSISRLLPLPIGQLIFYGVIAIMIVGIVRQVRGVLKHRFSAKQAAWNLGIDLTYFLSILYFLFMISWGFNYHRLPVAEIAELDVESIEVSELSGMCEVLIERCNEQRGALKLRNGELDLTNKEILTKAADGFSNVSKDYGFLAYQAPSVKQVLIPQLMSMVGVGGIYFMFTGEANVNMDPPNFLVPATTCHEMAHQVGFASEDEANYVGYLATQLNPDKNFQYSGNLMAMRYSMRALYRIDSVQYHRLAESISEEVLSDIRITRAYWRSFDNPLEPVSDAIYDLFLRANSQKAGIASYSQVVRLFVGEFRKGGLISPPERRSSGPE